MFFIYTLLLIYINLVNKLVGKLAQGRIYKINLQMIFINIEQNVCITV